MTNILDQCPVLILGTYHDKGAQLFWHALQQLQLQGHPILCWKFCHVLHKMIRDGHPQASGATRFNLLVHFFFHCIFCHFYMGSMYVTSCLHTAPFCLSLPDSPHLHCPSTSDSVFLSFSSLPHPYAAFVSPHSVHPFS